MGVIARASGGLERDAVGAFFEGVPGVEGVVGVADGAEELSLVEGHAVRSVDVGIGADEGGFGVEDETVEVEDEGADHEVVTGRPVGRPSMLRWFFSAR